MSSDRSVWLLGLLALLVAALTVSLGRWQADRAEQKEARQRLQDERSRQPVLTLDAHSTDAAALQARQVRAEGEFDEARTVLVDNKVHGGRPGYHVVAPLRIAGSASYVLVNQGWIAQGRTRSELPDVPRAAGRVTIEGRATIAAKEVFELRAETVSFRPGERTVLQNLLLERFAQASGLTLLPIVVLQTDGPPGGLVREWPLPADGVDKHRMYSMQWYSFAALAIVLYLVYLVRRRRVTR